MLKNSRLMIIISVILTLTIVFSISGCGTSQQPPKGSDNKQGQSSQPAPAKKIELTFATGSVGGTWSVIGAAMGKIIEDAIPGVKVTVLNGGAVANILGIAQGQYDIGFGFSSTAYEAEQGIAAFQDKGKVKTYALMGLYSAPLQIAVSADSNINEIEDLKGKKLAPGIKGMGGEIMVQDILKVHGMSYKDLAKVDFINYPEASMQLKDRQIDAFAPNAAPPTPTIQEAASGRGVRLVPLRPDKIAELKKVNPGYTEYVVPAKSYNGQEKEALCLASNNILLINPKLSDDLVYQITAAIFAKRDELAKLHVSMKDFTLENAVKDLGVQIHPGAEKFYKEKGAIK